MRTFVAIDLDEHLKTDLLALIGGLARRFGVSLRRKPAAAA